ncbi:hypothetical protein [Leptolyngbya sp. FACHB-261]|uniref:hypothetical protein n=1 Tax=Leptolyngbya sp. FACHB-261 TaxID=2692806 RepID=UPI00168463D3|nr:hypothetical protein [Leptolyngbya sp. FACHB-261]MBD2099881.1 hypothetical protein [Leptolyngbya sp. FACHB-261]
MSRHTVQAGWLLSLLSLAVLATPQVAGASILTLEQAERASSVQLNKQFPSDQRLRQIEIENRQRYESIRQQQNADQQNLGNRIRQQQDTNDRQIQEHLQRQQDLHRREDQRQWLRYERERVRNRR